jgi:arylsulfatase A-like enzyme
MCSFPKGIRVAALVSGGFLPENVRGGTLEGFIHECDWYATFCGLAGVDVHDDKAAAAGE